MVALLAGQRTCDSLVMGSSPEWTPLHSGLGHYAVVALTSLYASVIKQYNLLLANGVISLAGKITAGPVESIGSYHCVYD